MIEFGLARTSDKRVREAARRAFDAEYVRSGDYRAAARLAGVSERTGRRWRADASVQATASVATGSWTHVPTSFEGRRQELSDLDGRFRQGARLVTLLGPPGIGKTRLAAEWAASPAATSFGPALFCDVRGAVTVDALCNEVSRRLDVVLSSIGSLPPVEILARVFASRGRVTVILDNVEELDEAAVRAVGGWMGVAPEARFVTTSRRVLRLTGEHILDVGPLALPSAGSGSSAKFGSTDEEWTDAMRLFRTRALAVEPSLSASALSGALVARLVQRLDGIPLAIELAAAQTRKVGLPALCAMLDREVLSLTDPAVDADPRHATLRAAIEGGFRNLTRDEQKVLMHASIFRNGFTFAALSAVVGPETPIAAVRECLSGLRETSFLRPADDDFHERRWDMYEAIREYAVIRVSESGEAAATGMRHARYFLDWGEAWVDRLPTADGPTARATLFSELANLHAAFDTAEHAASASSTDLLRLASILNQTLASRFPRAAIAIADRALAAIKGLVDPGVQARVLIGRALVERETGSYDRAAVDLDHAARLVTDGSKSGQVACQGRAELDVEISIEKGMLNYDRGQAGRAREHLERAVETAAQSGLLHAEARARTSLAWILAEAYRDRAAFEHHPKAVSLMRQAGDVFGESTARRVWATHRLFFDDGDIGPELEGLVEQMQQLGAPYEEAYLRIPLSGYCREQGRLEEAEEHALQICSLADRGGYARVRGVGAIVLGMALDEHGLVTRASVAFEEAATIFAAIGDLRYGALADIFVGGIAAREGRVERAEQLLDRARALLREGSDLRFGELVEIQQGQVDLNKACQAAVSGDADRALGLRRRATQRIADARRAHSLGPAVELPLTQCCTEARHLVRLLERSIEAAVWRLWSLRISRDGSAFAVGAVSAPTVIEGPVIRRVLLALATQAVEAPGQPLAPADLLVRCWPGERMQRDAGLRRVRDLVKRLRRLGLEGILITVDGGYLVEPDVPVQVVEKL